MLTRIRSDVYHRALNTPVRCAHEAVLMNMKPPARNPRCNTTVLPWYFNSSRHYHGLSQASGQGQVVALR